MVSETVGKFKRLKIAAFLAAVVMTLSCSSAFNADNVISAQAVESGIITATLLNIRYGPGTEYDVVGQIKNGSKVDILLTEKSSSGTDWYKITYKNGSSTIEGYCSSSYISVNSDSKSPEYDYNADFEKNLSAQNFPESYKPYLRQLHAEHPNWVFTALNTGISWDDAVKNESVLGRNLVWTGSPDSWKSMEKGAYDFSSGKWYGLDGASWVAASSDIVKYYLDPRNFLNDEYIFMFESLSYKEDTHSESGVKSILADSFMKGSFTAPDTGKKYNYSEVFMEAAEISGVSPYHLGSRARQEQGIKGSPLSNGTVSGYSGYFNFFNIQAYSTSGMTAQQMGAKFASTSNDKYNLPWTNQYLSVVGGAKYLSSGYISKGQDTVYLQKFDMVDGGNGFFKHQYMTNVQAAASEAVSLKKAYTQELLAQPIEFEIPVFSSMPETAVAPPGELSNNNLLESLSVSEGSLSPKFNKYTQSYTVEVPADAESITLSAAASDKKATVKGTGKKSLTNEENNFTVTVTAQNKETRSYTVKIVRTKPAALKGDANLDGKVDILDASLILQGITNMCKLNGQQLINADADGNGKVNVNDVLVILRQISTP